MIPNDPKIQTWGKDMGYFGSRTEMNSSDRQLSSLHKAPACYLFWKQILQTLPGHTDSLKYGILLINGGSRLTTLAGKQPPEVKGFSWS